MEGLAFVLGRCYSIFLNNYAKHSPIYQALGLWSQSPALLQGLAPSTIPSGPKYYPILLQAGSGGLPE